MGGALIVALVVAYEISLLVRRGSGFAPFWDAIVLNVILVGCAAAVWMRVAHVRTDRGICAALAGALTAYALATIVYAGTTWLSVEPSSPSFADIGYLACNVLLGVAIAVQLRRIRGLTALVAMDAVMGALGAAAGMAVLIGPVILSEADVDLAGVLTAAAYPISDIVLMAGLAGLLALPLPHPGPHWDLIGLGVGVMVIADVIYTLRIAGGDYSIGQPVDGLWMIGLAIITFAVWMPRDRSRDAPATPRWALAAPVCALAVAIGVLVLGTQTRIPTAAVVLATLSLAVAVLRTALSFRDLRRLAEVEHQANTDPLTGLRNRRYAFDTMHLMLDTMPRDTQLAVVLIDVDRLKAANDSLGHAGGDDLLRHVASCIAHSIRPSDIAARVGGDEFLIASLHPAAAPEIAEPDAQAMAAHVRRAIETDHDLAVQPSVSIGVATGPYPGETIDTMVARADDQMYRDKRRRHRTPGGAQPPGT